jgi:fatty acid desaturase
MAGAAVTRVPVPLVPVVLLVANVAIGSRLVAIANLLHQASHVCLFTNVRINNAVGRVTAVLTFTTLSRYVSEHRVHHRHLGDSDDPKLQTYQHAGLAPVAKSKARVVADHLVLPLLGKGSWSWIKGTVNRQPEENWSQYSALCLTWVAATVASALAGLLVPFLLFAVLPQVLGKRPLRGFLDVLNHAGRIENAEPLRQSRNFTASPLVSFLLGGEPLLHGLSDDFLHGVHHPLHRVPQHLQAQAHQVLMADPAYALHNVPCAGVFRTRRSAVRPCALDDLTRSAS